MPSVIDAINDTPIFLRKPYGPYYEGLFLSQDRGLLCGCTSFGQQPKNDHRYLCGIA